MKHLFRVLVLLCVLAASQASAAITYSPVAVDANNTLKPGSTFFHSNLVSVADALKASSERIIYVSTNGNDSTAAIGKFLPYATIRAALSNAQNNCTIVIAPGTYTNFTPQIKSAGETNQANLYNLPFLLRDVTNVTIRAKGVKILGPGTGTYLGLLRTKNVTITGLDFDLTKGVGTEVTGICATIQLFGVNQNFSAYGISIKGSTDQGIFSDRNTYGYYVRGSYFEDIGATNVTYVTNAVPAPYVDGTAVGGFGSMSIVEGNTFVNCYRAIEWDEVAGATKSHSSLLVRGNIISNCYHTAIFTYSPNTNTCNLNGVMIEGNWIHMSTNAALAVDSRDNANNSQVGIRIGVGSDVQIRGNTVINGYDYGIDIETASHVERLIISDNIVMGITNASANRGITLRNYTSGTVWSNQLMRATVANNKVIGTGGNGYVISGETVTVTGNSCENCGMETSGQRYNYFVQSGTHPANGIIFSGNTSHDLKTNSFSYLIGVQTGAKQVYIGRDNWGRNVVNKGTSTTAPMEINSGSNSETYLDGLTGTATLVGGTVTVTIGPIRSTSKIHLTRATTGGTVGHLSYTISAGTSFTINSSSGTDTSTVNWMITEPQF